jgi:hypothetical protein
VRAAVDGEDDALRYQNRLVGSHVRATLLSLQSLLARLALAATLALLGVGLAVTSLAMTLVAVVVAVVVLGGALVRGAPPAACRAPAV